VVRFVALIRLHIAWQKVTQTEENGKICSPCHKETTLHQFRHQNLYLNAVEPHFGADTGSAQNGGGGVGVPLGAYMSSGANVFPPIGYVGNRKDLPYSTK